MHLIYKLRSKFIKNILENVLQMSDFRHGNKFLNQHTLFSVWTGLCGYPYKMLKIVTYIIICHKMSQGFPKSMLLIRCASHQIPILNCTKLNMLNIFWYVQTNSVVQSHYYKLRWSQASWTQYTMTSCDTTYFQQDEELLSDDTSEYDVSYTSECSFSYSQGCSSVQSLPMSENWFGDGIAQPFKESVSCTSLIQFLWTIYH